MAKAQVDDRTSAQRASDEAIAAEPKLTPPTLPTGAVGTPLEAHLRSRRPMAVAGIVENGLVRPLDPNVKLKERSRVIIVGAE